MTLQNLESIHNRLATLTDDGRFSIAGKRRPWRLGSGQRRVPSARSYVHCAHTGEKQATRSSCLSLAVSPKHCPPGTFISLASSFTLSLQQPVSQDCFVQCFKSVVGPQFVSASFVPAIFWNRSRYWKKSFLQKRRGRVGKRNSEIRLGNLSARRHDVSNFCRSRGKGASRSLSGSVATQAVDKGWEICMFCGGDQKIW